MGGVVPDTKVRLKLPQTSVATIVSLPGLVTPAVDGSENGFISVKTVDDPIEVSSSSWAHIPYQTEYRHDIELDDVSYISRVAAPDIPFSGIPVSAREDFVILDHIQDPRPTTSYSTSKTIPTDVRRRNNTEYDLIPKTDLRNWRTNSQLPGHMVEPINRPQVPHLSKPPKDTPQIRMEATRNLGYKTPIQHQNVNLRGKGASQQSHSYHTSGYVPQSGISVGTGGRGL
jgi:hypothetical protein